MGTLVAIAAVTAAAVTLGLLGRTRYGELRLMELAGALWVALAGRRHRTQMAEILGARKRERS